MYIPHPDHTHKYSTQGAMEMPQHGNVSTFLKKKQKPLKDVSAISARKTDIPHNPVFEGFQLFT